MDRSTIRTLLKSWEFSWADNLYILLCFPVVHIFSCCVCYSRIPKQKSEALHWPTDKKNTSPAKYYAQQLNLSHSCSWSLPTSPDSRGIHNTPLSLTVKTDAYRPSKSKQSAYSRRRKTWMQGVHYQARKIRSTESQNC